MNLSEFSVKNSLLVNALTAFLVITGLMAIPKIKREAFPNFSFDIVTVMTDYQGASPETVERRITIPIEKELKEVADIDEMGSISIEGLSLIVLKLDPDAKNKDRIFNDIERAVGDARDLPADLRQDPRVSELQTKDTPIVEIALSGNLPEKELREAALNLENELLDISEVSTVERKGVRDHEIWVEVDPESMRKHAISLSQVLAALAQRNVNVSGGLYKDSPELILRTSGELESSQDVSSVVLRANEEGHWVQVGDVARVRDSFEELQTQERTDGTRSLNLWVLKKENADAIRLMDKVHAAVDEFRKTNKPELKIALVNDISYYIKRRLNVLVSNGWIGFLFVMVPMIFFLSWRVALGAAMGMGIAMLTALAGMSFFGVSINLISMFGMIMVLGMLVDEDLVISDNISRYLEEGKSYTEAAILGASEVASAIVSTVLTTIIAFVPLLFMTGIFGKFIQDIPKVVIITLVASLVEALIILPSHLAELSRTKKEGQSSAYVKRAQHHYFDRFRETYLKSLQACLKRPVVTTAVSFLILFGAAFYAVFGMKFILFPAKGVEAFFLRAEAPIGTSLEAMEEKMKPLEALIAGLPEGELDHYVTQVGIVQNDPSDPFTMRGSHLGQIAVYLTPESKRAREADLVMEDLRGKLPKTVSEDSEFTRLSFDPVKTGPPVGKPVAVRIRGEDYTVLNTLVDRFKTELATVPGVNDIQDDYEEGKGELLVVIDENAAAMAGLTYDQIAQTVRQAFQGAPATTIRKTDDEIDVVVRLPEELRKDLSAIESLLVMNRYGNLIPLSRVARLEKASGVGAIKHVDGKRVITVTANVDEKITTSGKVNGLLQKKFESLPQEFPGVTLHYGGEEEDTQKSMDSLFRALIGAMILIFVILLVTFGSALQTIIIMLSIPFGLVGVVIGFALMGEPIGFLAFLGIIGLTGVVVDGGTLIMVFINRLKKDGADLKALIIEGCGVRFRSILLTTLTTVLGVIPAAYGIGGQDPFIQPMAIALNWGIGISIFFNLYTLPCLYYLADKMAQGMKARLSRA